MEPRRQDSCSSREPAPAQPDVDAQARTDVNSGDKYVASEIRPTCVWMVDDDNDQRRQSVDRLVVQGSRVHSIQTRATTSKDKSAQLQYELIQAGPALVWVKMPGAPCATLDRNVRRRLGSLTTLCNLQLCRGRHVLAEVPYKGIAADCIREHMPLEAYATHCIPWCSLGVHHPQSTGQ